MRSIEKNNRSYVNSVPKKRSKFVKDGPILEEIKKKIRRAKLFNVDMVVSQIPDQNAVNYLIACGYRWDDIGNGTVVIKLI